MVCLSAVAAVPKGLLTNHWSVPFFPLSGWLVVSAMVGYVREAQSCNDMVSSCPRCDGYLEVCGV